MFVLKVAYISLASFIYVPHFPLHLPCMMNLYSGVNHVDALHNHLYIAEFLVH